MRQNQSEINFVIIIAFKMMWLLSKMNNNCVQKNLVVYMVLQNGNYNNSINSRVIDHLLHHLVLLGFPFLAEKKCVKYP